MTTAPIIDRVVLRRFTFACCAIFAVSLLLAVTLRAGDGADRVLFDLVIDNRNQFIVDLARSIVPLGETVPVLVLAGLCAVSLQVRRVDLRLVALAPGAAVLTGILVWAMKSIVERHGPAVQLRGVAEPSNSFPSGHAALSAAVFVAIGLIITVDAGVPPNARRWVFMVCALLAAAVSWSTVALHMHWPTESISGSALGAAVASLLCIAAQSPRLRSPISARRGLSNGP